MNIFMHETAFDDVVYEVALLGLLSWYPAIYCQTSSISHTKSQNWNVYFVVSQLSLTNPLKPDVKSWMISNFIAY